ncbi:hypothetical protein [Pleomorphochaeta sp. DL1XJH-081]|uniref:hypothetical protein n=1 Tax=Pleomorphochaeta sp. DL1XJH-081 TaxID=3409690 RepID=UPI003BB74D11
MKHVKGSKRRLVLLTLVMIILIMCSVGCGGPITGSLRGMRIFVTRGQDDVARGATDSSRYVPASGDSSSIPGDFFQPKDITIAFDKVWFPTRTAYDSMVDEDTNEENIDGDCLFIKDRETIPTEGFFKPIDSFTTVTASTSDAYTPASNPAYGETYYGVLVDIVYYEYEMEDFSLRWYTQDHGDYLAKDVLIKTPDSTVWEFPYFKLSSGDLTFVVETSRKTVSPGNLMQPSTSGEHYFCITTDGLQDGPSGIRDAWESFFDPILIAGHATPSNPNPLENPNTINIFDEDENEAQYYLFQMCLNTDSDFSVNRYNGLHLSPGITADQDEDDTLTYAAFLNIINTNINDTDNDVRDPLDSFPDDNSWIYTGVSPVGSGMDTRFGYIDFEDNPQGEFSPGAGW